MNAEEPACFAFLGLRPDSDERSVKRVYAKLLRNSRPDEDPAAFQTLHENYQQALAFIAWREHQTMRVCLDDAENIRQREADLSTAGELKPHATAAQQSEHPVPTAFSDVQPADTQPQASTASSCEPMFDLSAFYVEMLLEAKTRDAQAFAHWLQAQRALWSFELKAEVGARILHQFFQDAPPMGETQFDSLLAFFDMDHVFAMRDPLAVDNLRNAMATRHDLNDANPLMFEIRMKRAGGLHGSETSRFLAELKRPWSKSRALMKALMPGSADPYARFLRIASRGHLELLTPPVDLRWSRFWVNAAGGFGITRLVVGLGLARCAILILILFGFSLLGTLSASPMHLERIATNAIWFLIAGVALCGLWLLWLGVRLTIAWQGMSQNDRPGWERWLRVGFVPLLCLVGGTLADRVAVAQSGWFSLSVFSFSSTILFVAVRRYRIRAQSPPIRWGRSVDMRIAGLLAFFAVQIIIAMASAMVDSQRSASRSDDTTLIGILCFTLIGLALIAWFADLWKQRHSLHARRAIA